MAMLMGLCLLVYTIGLHSTSL